MTPKPTKGRAAARDARQAALGITDEDLIAKYKKFVLPVARYVSVSSLKAHDRVRTELDGLLRLYTPKVHGQRVTSWADLVEKKLSFPATKFTSTVILNRAKLYEKDRQLVKKQPHASHLERFWTYFCAVWNSEMPVQVTQAERARGHQEALKIAADRNFSTDPPRKPVVTVESLQDILRGVWTTAFRGTLESRVNVVTYLALSTSTAGRPGSFLRPTLGTIDKTILERSDVDPDWMTMRALARKKMNGAEFRQFQLHLLPPAQPGQCNRLVGFYKSSWAKNQLDKGKWFMLLPGPTYGTSPCIMLMVTLVIHNKMSVDDLRRMLDPASLGEHEHLRIVLPTAARRTNVMTSRRGRPCTTEWMTGRLQQLSHSLGFKELWTASTPMHLAKQSMKGAGVSIADMRATLKHHKNSKATAAYEDVMAGRALNIDQEGLGTDMQSSSGAPVALTASEMEEVKRLAEEEVRAAQDSVAAQCSAVAAGSTSAPSDAAPPAPSDAEPSGAAASASQASGTSKSTSKSTSTLPASKIRTARERLVKRKLADLRDAYFSEESLSKRSRPVETTAAHFRAFVYEEWHDALNTPLTESPEKLFSVLEKLIKSGKSAEACGSGDEEEDDSDNESVDEGGDEVGQTDATDNNIDKGVFSSLNNGDEEDDESEFEEPEEDGEEIPSDDDDEEDPEWTYSVE